MADAPGSPGAPGNPKIQIDTDWKAQAQKEKERLARQEQEKSKAASAGGASPSSRGEPGGAGAAGPGAPGAGAGTPGAGAGVPGAEAPGGALPKAEFRSLMGILAQQAIMGLGVMADQQTGRVVVDLEGSRFSIDLLDVLEQKTRGNLSKDEADELKQILAELRSRYVQISNLVARQMAAQAEAQMKAVSESKLTT
jgi:hypothetical protein